MQWEELYSVVMGFEHEIRNPNGKSMVHHGEQMVSPELLAVVRCASASVLFTDLPFCS